MIWLAGGVVLLLLAAIVLYNRLVRAKVKVRQAWAQVDAQLQRRHDLVPNLVATVGAYAAHERDVFERVTRTRSAALAVTDPVARQAAEDRFGAALGGLLALSERYPDLKADGNFRHLQAELSATEDRLAFARDFATDRVARYRKLTDTVPGLLIARPFGFPREAMFATDDERARHSSDVRLGG
ncbi:MAG: LemA family protein [Nitriliruptor sp.]|nr:MAG: LemA family protein [Nitriliruptor sp.]